MTSIGAYEVVALCLIRNVLLKFLIVQFILVLLSFPVYAAISEVATVIIFLNE